MKLGILLSFCASSLFAQITLRSNSVSGQGAPELAHVFGNYF
jgi:hypothetical protein